MFGRARGEESDESDEFVLMNTVKQGSGGGFMERLTRLELDGSED